MPCRYIVSPQTCLKCAFDNSLKSYPADLHHATGITCSSVLLETQPWLFRSWFMLGAGLRCRNVLPAAWGIPVGRVQTHFTLCLMELYSNQRKQTAGFEDTVNFALTAGSRVRQWQPAIRDTREENKKWWRETATAQRVHSVPILRSLRVPYRGKETIKMFIKKNVTLGIYYLLQVFINYYLSDIFQ